MSSFIHTVHEYILLLARYLVIFTVIGFMPIPLFSFLGGDSLTQVDYNPLFEYFNHYQITTDSIIENVFTNAFISENKNDIQEWQIDNALLWADGIAFKLTEERIPVIRKVIASSPQSKVDSLHVLYQQTASKKTLLPEEMENTLMVLKGKFQLLSPVGPLIEDARQWIILALNSNQKTIKKQLKQLISSYPNDNFLVVTQTPVNLNKKTSQVILPDFDIKQAKKSLSEGLKITESQAEILLIEKNKSLWALNNQKRPNQQISFKSLLGKNYRPLVDIPEKQAAVLQQLCKEGKAKLNKKIDLTQYGVIIKNKNYQWENQNAKINYQLQKETLCGKRVWIDQENENQVDSQTNKSEKLQETINQKAQQDKIEDQQHQENQKDEENDRKSQKTEKESKSGDQKKDKEQKDSKKNQRKSKYESKKGDKKGPKKDEKKSEQNQQKNQKEQNIENKADKDNKDTKQQEKAPENSPTILK